MTKSRRGDCGSCHWFERGPVEPVKDAPWEGSCLARPSVPTLTTQLQRVVTAQGPQVQQVPFVMSMLSQTMENRRCEKWRPAGTQPPWDDHNKREPTK